MIEEIKLIGSLAGLGTLIFTLYDRLRAGAPWLDIVPRGPPGSRGWCLKITNPSKSILFIRSVVWLPKIYQTARENTLVGVIRAAAGHAPTLIIPGEATFLLPLILTIEPGTPEATKRALVIVHWRRGRSHWLWTMPRLLWVSRAELDSMSEAQGSADDE